MGKFRTKRSTMVRIWQIYNLIKNMNYPDAQRLANHLEVSRRTVERDLEQLRDQMHAPIVFDRLHRGYFFDGDYSLPPIRFTDGEIISMIIGQKLLARMEGTETGTIFGDLRTKLECLLGEENSFSNRELEEVISFGIEPLRGEDRQVAYNLTELQKALSQHHEVEMLYNSLSAGEKKKRVVRPYHLRFFNGVWYLIGYCLLHREVRIFAINRIENLRATETTFDYPEDFNIDEYLEGAWGIMRGRRYQVKIRFDSYQARWIRERSLRDGERMEELKDGSIIFETIASGLTEITQWVLGFGSHAEVLEPAELRETIEKEILQMKDVYEK